MLLASAIIYGCTLISLSIYSLALNTGNQGWDLEYGLFGTSVREVGTIPLIVATLSGIAGIVIIVSQDKKT